MRLAVSWMTVLPVRGPDTVDRAAAARAISLLPVIGALLGAGAGGVLWVAEHGLPPALSGLLAVAALALATRGMHLDGLADTFDGLGCYGPPERARAVMSSGGVGPFGVLAIVFAVGAQVYSFAVLDWQAVCVAVAAGRVAVVLACRRGIEAARADGLGALVAGSQPRWIGAAWAAALAAVSVFATDRWWQGPLAIVAALAVSLVLVRHCVRRFAGVNGDVLGAAVELTVTIAAIGLALR